MKTDMGTKGVVTVPAAMPVARWTAAVLLPFVLGACSWFTDFKEQPSIKPWESVSQNVNDTITPPRGQPLHSVPVQGTVSAAYAISHAAMPATIDSFSPIANPTAADLRSLTNGRMYYQINCAVCHGMAGDANGGLKRVNAGYGFAPSLLTPIATGRTDGYYYGIIRNGRGVMPNYNRIEEADRWDVVNYVRALQAGTADTTLAGWPGEGGTAVPGPTQTAPTRPSPFVRPTISITPGSPNINSATYKGASDSAASKEKHE